MIIVNLTYNQHSENIIEIMFHSFSGDWFTILFPLSDFYFDKMKNFYIGKEFYPTKKSYQGCIFSECGVYDI